MTYELPAPALNEKWRGAGPIVPVAVIDLAWLLDGYVRARQASLAAASPSPVVPEGDPKP